MPGETWISNCNQCVCMANTSTVQCEPIQCPQPADVTCNMEGYIIVQVPVPEQPCCLMNNCRCDVRYCSNVIKSCALGFEVVTTYAEGDCCLSQICRPMNVCVVNEAVFQPGQPIPPTNNPCEDCRCTDEKDAVTMLNLVVCKPVSCITDCQQGFQYKTIGGKCCGECVQVSCIMKIDDGTTIVIQPGETWYAPGSNCSYYQCQKINEQHVLISRQRSCAVSSPRDCKLGYEYMMVAGECCGTCEQVNCTMQLEDQSTKVLQPGEAWYPPNERCLHFECNQILDQFHLVSLVVSCPSVECAPGFMYKENISNCCGECTKVSCAMKMEDNTIKILQPGDTWTPPGKKCLSYRCDDMFELVATKIICAEFDPTKCEEGTITMADDGCCQVCDPIPPVKKCDMIQQSTRIKSGDCESNETVELPYCAGNCQSSSRYSMQTGVMDNECTCCRILKTSMREVTLTCPNGSFVIYTYKYVEKCACSILECKEPNPFPANT
ncbi:hypothetical protein FKM82_003183 [Ascaphus truei]